MVWYVFYDFQPGNRAGLIPINLPPISAGEATYLNNLPEWFTAGWWSQTCHLLIVPLHHHATQSHTKWTDYSHAKRRLFCYAQQTYTTGDFTFWISLSLSLFAQSEIRTEWKLNQKVKSIFFVRTRSELRTELRTERNTELIVWSEVRTESKINLNYWDSVQMNLDARGRLIPYRLTFAEWKTTSLFRLVQTNRIAKKSDLSPWRNNY